jgi:SIS domain
MCSSVIHMLQPEVVPDSDGVATSAERLEGLLTMSRKQAIHSLREGALLRLQLIETCLEAIVQSANAIYMCLGDGGKVLFFGNGGSAADAQHLAAVCADAKLLVPLKRSRTYGKIRPRVADLRPIDSWQQDKLHFFVFRLKPLDGVALPEPPLAVFAVHPAAAEPASAVVVSPHRNGVEAGIVSLLQPENGHV